MALDLLTADTLADALGFDEIDDCGRQTAKSKIAIAARTDNSFFPQIINISLECRFGILELIAHDDLNHQTAAT